MSNDIHHHILDSIVTSNDVEKVGVVDYINDRFIHFFDFSEIQDPDVVLMVVLWRTRFAHMRFSLFASIHFPKITLPRVTLINKRGLNDYTSNTEVTTVSLKNSKKEKFSVEK